MKELVKPTAHKFRGRCLIDPRSNRLLIFLSIRRDFDETFTKGVCLLFTHTSTKPENPFRFNDCTCLLIKNEMHKFFFLPW